MQKELALSEQQKTKVAQLVDDNRNAIHGSFQLSPEERQTKMQERVKETNKKIADILSAPQNERFDQISLQLSVQTQGPGAFIRPEVADKLGLTSEQKDKIQAIVDELGGLRRDIFQHANGNFQAAQEQTTKLTTEEKDKAVALLTDDQKKKWETLTGKEFKIDLTQMRPGFGGRWRRLWRRRAAELTFVNNLWRSTTAGCATSHAAVFISIFAYLNVSKAAKQPFWWSTSKVIWRWTRN